MVGDADHDDAPEGRVGLTVPATVEPEVQADSVAERTALGKAR